MKHFVLISKNKGERQIDVHIMVKQEGKKAGRMNEI
jgi:hypothetical protein